MDSCSEPLVSLHLDIPASFNFFLPHVTDKVASSSNNIRIALNILIHQMDPYLIHLTAPTGNTAEHVTISPSQPAQLAGTKRKSTGSSELPTINLDDYDIPDGHPMDSCTVVRGKIKRFLEAGEMKVGQFCDAIGVSQNAYRRFMAQNGKFGGDGCATYQNAWEFFKKREMAGLKIPTKKQKTAATTASSSVASSSERKDAVTPDISHIHLDGNQDIVQMPCGFTSADEMIQNDR